MGGGHLPFPAGLRRVVFLKKKGEEDVIKKEEKEETWRQIGKG